MASINKFGEKWRAHLYVKGHRETKVFRTRSEAVYWASGREGELRERVDSALVPFLEYAPLTKERLREQPEVTSLTRNSGVYFLWDFTGQLVYIGQSKDVSMRVAMHRKRPPAPFDRATYIKVPHPWQLAFERLYIDRYLGEALDPASGVCLANCA